MDFHCRVIFKCVNEIERFMEGFVGAPSRKKNAFYLPLLTKIIPLSSSYAIIAA